jgi:hypothetical protein
MSTHELWLGAMQDAGMVKRRQADKPAEELADVATKALKASVKLSNEIIGTMSLIERGIPVTPGIIKAMHRYLKDVETYVREID